ncbi:hypothetical protein QF037_000138 [Streptomyces canus]|uniref:EthD domain-containing protein n=1 Tax=Streptomyces canus TaxID=58343 RepID=UPI0027897DED|nr:EthD domain-containing protein [Streptomyces canus]MDQ0595793.1 hypothetical protein [Streptomyces canus]
MGYQLTLPRDSVTELYFDDLESMAQTFADPYTRDVVGPDGANFSDQAAAVSLLVEESGAEVPRSGTGTVKILHFLKAAEGLAPGAFQEGLRRAYEDLFADSAGPARYVRGHRESFVDTPTFRWGETKLLRSRATGCDSPLGRTAVL